MARCRNLALARASDASDAAYATRTLSSRSLARPDRLGQTNSGNTLASEAGKVSTRRVVSASARTAAARTAAAPSAAEATQKGTMSCRRASSSATAATRDRSPSASLRSEGRTAPRTHEHTTEATRTAPGKLAPRATASAMSAASSGVAARIAGAVAEIEPPESVGSPSLAGSPSRSNHSNDAPPPVTPFISSPFPGTFSASSEASPRRFPMSAIIASMSRIMCSVAGDAPPPLVAGAASPLASGRAGTGDAPGGLGARPRSRTPPSSRAMSARSGSNAARTASAVWSASFIMSEAQKSCMVSKYAGKNGSVLESARAPRGSLPPLFHRSRCARAVGRRAGSRCSIAITSARASRSATACSC